MSEAVWYFVDRSQQRNGPVTAAAVVEAHASGRIDDSSLVWREGLSAWAPLADHRAELGISGPPSLHPAPAPSYPAYPPPPQKSSKKLGCLIIGIVCVVGVVPVLGILAAIALPAYQEYVARAQTAGALNDVRGYVTAAEEFRVRNERCPTAADLGAEPEVRSGEGRATAIDIGEDYAGNCRIEGRLIGGNAAVQGATIALTRDENGQWQCTGSVSRPKFLPSGCAPE